MEKAELVELVEENVGANRCYCLRSKPQSTGYIFKIEWQASWIY